LGPVEWSLVRPHPPHNPEKCLANNVFLLRAVSPLSRLILSFNNSASASGLGGPFGDIHLSSVLPDDSRHSDLASVPL
jgi:hypothetical protein